MLEKYEYWLEQYIEASVTSECDDHLFAVGYLQGHLAVVFSQLEEKSKTSLADIKETMSQCLSDARSELSPEDFLLISQEWENMFDNLCENFR